MLNENIKIIRKSKGLSQEELAIKLNVVRQTVSKWENGLSVPDSTMLISIAEILDTSVSELLGETPTESNTNDLNAIAEKLEVINLQLARREHTRIRNMRIFLAFICVLILVIFAGLLFINGSYMDLNYNDPESAIAGTIMHGFEFVFVRLAPFVFLAAVIGLVMSFACRKNR